MRKNSLLAQLGLAFAILATSGCCCWYYPCGGRPDGAPADIERDPGPPSLTPGVVTIFKNDPSERLVGYMSPDPTLGSVTWWLLNNDEEPPVVPYMAAHTVVMKRFTTVSKTGAQLCSAYRMNLMPNSKIWRLDRYGEPTTCD